VRERIPRQTDPYTPETKHSQGERLAEIDRILRLFPEWEAWVHADLSRGVSSRRGRKGLSAFVVLRVIILKHLLNVSLRKLAFLLADSLSMRAFLGLEPGVKAPPRSTLQNNVRKVSPETWGRIHQSFARSNEVAEFESGEKVRIDPTVVETNIHFPSDSSLLWDSIRTLTRLMRRGSEWFAEVEFEDRSRIAKRLHTKIYWARRKAQRVPAYRDLLAEAKHVAGEASHVQIALRAVQLTSVIDGAMRDALVAELGHYQGLMARVMDQTERRILHGETVPANEKVYSIFEPHTDMIKKSPSRPPEFGHKVTLTVGKHFVLDCVIERGNPNDANHAVRQIERQIELLGRAPKQAAFDGGFASADNLKDIKALGVERCAFSKGKGLTPEEMAGSRRTYERLKRFRAGVEGKISWLKRDFGLGRCTWKGEEGFAAYVWSATLAANLSKLARLRLEKTKKGASSVRRRAAA
jgi:IS5 family transposase